MSGTQRAHILIPGDLLREIDDLVGPRGRSAFLLETARQEVQRRKLLRVLESEQPVWKTADHPELKGGTVAYVQQLRRQSERRNAAETHDRQRQKLLSVRDSSTKPNPK
jgi:metal-responsive CopG/Arc/MetJ family transcriptional regulator